MTESTSIHSSLPQTLPVVRVRQMTVHIHNLWQVKENTELLNGALKIPYSTTRRNKTNKQTNRYQYVILSDCYQG